jgi:glycosyltransferase involved in cell wall biosynthesis
MERSDKSVKVFFYPHRYLRDRQLDTVRYWPSGQALNPELARGRQGSQVAAEKAKSGRVTISWKQRLPLVNLKLRPSEAPDGAVVYVWGGLIATGDFIVDLDNPWALTGYNLGAMKFYRVFIQYILLSERCREIRCISEACRESLRLLFGEKVYGKASIHYPVMRPAVSAIPTTPRETRFLFVGTQFEIKGGEALLRAFTRVFSRQPNCKLDIVTHMPSELAHLSSACPGITVHEAHYTRDEIHAKFMKNADVLVLPTYVESFGMVALEALAHGLALVVTDVYALKEMAKSGYNGDLLRPPISIWDGYLPSKTYFELHKIRELVRSSDTSAFEEGLMCALERFVKDGTWLLRARRASLTLMMEKFSGRLLSSEP